MRTSVLLRVHFAHENAGLSGRTFRIPDERTDRRPRAGEGYRGVGIFVRVLSEDFQIRSTVVERAVGVADGTNSCTFQPCVLSVASDKKYIV